MSGGWAILVRWFSTHGSNRGIQGFERVPKDAARQLDFVTTSSIRIGVKTVNREAPPREDYTIQISARPAEELIDQFFFMTHEIARRRMWLLGGLDGERLLRSSLLWGWWTGTGQLPDSAGV